MRLKEAHSLVRFQQTIILVLFAATFSFSISIVESADPVGPTKEKVPGESSEPSFRVQKSLPIKMMFNQRYHLVADLGTLPAGLSGVVEIELVNPTDTRFSVRDAKGSCSCAEGVLGSDEIKPFSSVPLTIELETPKSSSHVVDSFSIKLLTDGGEANDITIVGRYRLGGLLCFVKPNNIYELDGSASLQTILLPVNLTAPIEAKDVEVEFTSLCEGLRVQLEKQADKHFAKISVDTELMPEEGLHRQLVIRTRDGSIRGETMFSLWRSKEFEISPRTLRFREVGGRHIASCLIRHRPVSEGDLDKTMYVEAAISGKTLKVDQTPLSNGIYRIKISTSKPEFSKMREQGERDHLEVTWDILSGKKRLQLKSPTSSMPKLFNVQ